jgi:hypothetical protein
MNSNQTSSTQWSDQPEGGKFDGSGSSGPSSAFVVVTDVDDEGEAAQWHCRCQGG